MTVLHVALLTSVGDATELPLTSELLVEHLELVDKFLADGGEDITGSDGAVSLDANKELRDVRVGNLVASHVDVGVHLEMLGEKVTESVVFLLQDEVGGVGHAREHLFLNLFLPVIEDEEFETIGSVHLGGLDPVLERSVWR